MTARYRVGQDKAPTGEADGDAEADADGDGTVNDEAAVARGEIGVAGVEAGAEATVEAVADVVAERTFTVGAGAADGDEPVHPATPIPTTTAAAATPATARADRAEPNIPDLFQRPRRRG